ncbi:hypothetical protein [Aeromicrobium phoceense]|uniref:hypothetical protein n=2 Tax=Aeromicrobium TaxID=2040 RepID=UPI0028AF6A82|nr:hypothetical protein [Aeromicrobium phoceense]
MNHAIRLRRSPLSVVGTFIATLGMTFLLSACSAETNGVVAVSRIGSGMELLIVPCEGGRAERVTLHDVSEIDSGKVDTLGRLVRTHAPDGVVELSPSNPGAEWSGSWVDKISELQPGVPYDVGAYGDQLNTEDTTFTRADLEGLAEGTWLYPDPETLGLLTASTAQEVADEACEYYESL